MQTTWERRTRPRGRAGLVYALYYWAKVWLWVLGILPVAVAMIVGTVQGTAVDGLFFPAPDYPALTTLSGLLVVPAFLLLGAAIASIPLPLEQRKALRRADLGWFAVLGFFTALVSLVLDDGRPAWLHAAPYVAAAIFAAVVVLLLVRGLLGMTRVLPKSWRGNYRTEIPKDR